MKHGLRACCPVIIGLLFSACATMGPAQPEKSTVIKNNLDSCMGNLTTDELVMFASTPSERVPVDDGEIWIYKYRKTNRSTTTTTTGRGSLLDPRESESTTTDYEYKFDVRLRFNKEKVLSNWSYSGNYQAFDHPFLTHTCQMKSKEYPAFGFVGGLTEGGVLTVVTVDNSGPAQEAGILAGDQIVGFKYNGRSILEMSEKDRDALGNNPATQVTMIVKRAGFATPRDFPISRTSIQEKEYGGIGVTTRLAEGILTIATVKEGGPAQKGGILSGDQILKIDDLSTKGMTDADTTSIIRGKPGTRVTLTIMRQGFEAPREITISRALIRTE